jgi:hypothetical protein
MGLGRVVVYGLLLAGCNQVFGLEGTELEQDDVDGDGIRDAEDNCATIANAGQADGDSDGLGDACDLCPQLSSADQHDEDRDGIGDACDACPGRPDFSADADQDGVGDECDFDQKLSMRTGFDGFVGEGDLLGPSGTPGRTLPTYVLSGDFWWIEIRLRLEQPWQPGDRFGIVIHDAQTGDVATQCLWDCSTQPCALQLGTSTTTYGLRPEPSLVLRMEVTGQSSIICRVGTGNASFGASLTGRSVWPELVASANARIAYVEAVR